MNGLFRRLGDMSSHPPIARETADPVEEMQGTCRVVASRSDNQAKITNYWRWTELLG